MKNWYFIDCKLQDIPNERKGLYLETYQTAIHTSREIFIDSNSYKEMYKEERAKLLLHEMIMSYYLIKYLSLDDLCKMSVSCSGDYQIIGRWKMFRPETYRPLSEEDHQKIRNVTAWIWEQRESLTTEGFSKMVRMNDFDKRFETVWKNSSSFSKEIEIDIANLVRMFKKYQWGQSFPEFCKYAPDTGVSSSKCHVEINTDIRDFKYTPDSKMKQLYLRIKITRESDKKEFEQEFSYPLNPQSQKVKLFTSKIGSVLSAAPFGLIGNWPGYSGVPIQEGLKSHMLFFMLNLSDQENPEIYQIMFETYIWYSFEDEIIKKDGVTYKETYGYRALIEDETEILFIENELPFRFIKSPSHNKVSIKSTQQ